jgi:GT2 family glycosyltransferase
MTPVAINLAVRNAQAWLPAVLDSVMAQSYPNIRITLWDNGSSDATAEIVRRYPAIRYLRTEDNLGFWTPQEEMFSMGDEPYVICLTDVILDPGFVAAAVHAMENDATLGAVQGKIYQMQWRGASAVKSTVIDALGFRLQPSRRVTILGHGVNDVGQYATMRDIFAVEGAVPVYRRTAIEHCRVDGHFADTEYREGAISYGDDVDMGWRMTLFGWRQVMLPTAIGWHDRSTTKGTATVPVLGQLSRIGIRALIPLQKRRLDAANARFTIIKNDHTLNLLLHLPLIAVREAAVLAYTLVFEPRVLVGWGRALRLLPVMLRRRRAIMAKARLTAADMRRFIT